ncbi:SAF domain-containing protein [Amycolatopsis aidingensis]|uniref:SAF domain-containing protein n=1 Tax=Amycolatopsis aidingensis TaxID=2842453 RepID=UPI001E2912A7|nr:SAF domain-containing protein [Amycolatopsis aidingensis]
MVELCLEEIVTHTYTTPPETGPEMSGSAAWLGQKGKPTPVPRAWRRHRLPYLVAGVLLVVVCVGGAVWWTTTIQDRVPMLALAKPVTVGHVLTRADLRSVDVSAAPGVALIPADQVASVVGRPMATSLGPGALLAPDAVGSAVIPAVGRAVVAVGVKPGQFPPELTAGASVTVVVTAATGTGTSATTAQRRGPGTSWHATIVGVAPAGADQSTVVSLDLDAGAASQLAQVPAGQLALVMQPAGGGR